MWLWKAEEKYQRVPAIIEVYLTPQEMARLTDLRQRLHTISEFVCRDEERRLMTIRIQSISVHYDLSIPPEFREATERALRVHTEGCPAHQSVKDAIKVTWEATLRSGDEVISLKSEEEGE